VLRAEAALTLRFARAARFCASSAGLSRGSRATWPARGSTLGSAPSSLGASSVDRPAGQQAGCQPPAQGSASACSTRGASPTSVRGRHGRAFHSEAGARGRSLARSPPLPHHHNLTHLPPPYTHFNHVCSVRQGASRVGVAWAAGAAACSSASWAAASRAVAASSLRPSPCNVLTHLPCRPSLPSAPCPRCVAASSLADVEELERARAEDGRRGWGAQEVDSLRLRGHSSEAARALRLCVRMAATGTVHCRTGAALRGLVAVAVSARFSCASAHRRCVGARSFFPLIGRRSAALFSSLHLRPASIPSC
jgi:hypothetical protein